MDHLLDILETDPQFRHFSLDAQTIVLEDYLKIRPEARERIEAHVRSGRLGIGPWYQLNDEFLVSGEATIRSLLIGTRIARSFGDCLKVGYLPDQFGNISQMPQILRGFGIDNAIMGRGRQLHELGDRMEFWWVGPDGSRVLSSLMAYWYNNAQYMPEDPVAALEFVRGLRDTMAARSAASDLLFMNGVDHLEAQPKIGQTVAAVAERLAQSDTEDTIVHSTLSEYVDALRATFASDDSRLQTVRGELRQDRGGACLAGTLSSRSYLKKANFAAQTALEAYSERLCGFAFLLGKGYPADELRYAWKLLMENHPHDSICGCSIDQVHDEMMPRFDRVRQVAGFVQENALDALTGRNRTEGAIPLPCDLHVINTLNWVRTDPVRVTLEVPLGPPSRGNAQKDTHAIVRGLRILGPDGAPVEYGIVQDEITLATVLNPHELPLDQWVQRIAIEFVAKDVPGCGTALYRVEPANHWPTGLHEAEHNWRGPILEDVGDVGDEYLYRPPVADLRIQCCLECCDDWGVTGTPVRRTTVTNQSISVPAATERAARSERLVPMEVELEVTSWKGVPRTEYCLTIENEATDHRVRALFDAGGAVSAASPFDVVTRAPDRNEAEAGAATYHPMTLWVSASGSGDEPGMTAVAPGLYEYERYTDSDGRTQQIGITLLRCVRQLSGRGDGPGIPTPGAQCQGKHRFDLAVVEHKGDWQVAKAWKQAHQFATPLVAVQSPRNDYGPATRTFLTIEPDALVLSAVKRAEDRDTLIVRCYNITDDPIVNGRISVHHASSWRRTNLNEEPVGEWSDGADATLEVGPKQIVTIEFRV